MCNGGPLVDSSYEAEMADTRASAPCKSDNLAMCIVVFVRVSGFCYNCRSHSPVSPRRVVSAVLEQRF